MVKKEDLSEVVDDELNEVLSLYTHKELMEMTHEYTKDYILAADRKASILLTGLFGLLGLSANALREIKFNFDGIIGGLFLIAAIWGIIAIVCAALVIYPRLYKDPEGFDRGYIYWERIKAHGSQENFVNNTMCLDEKEHETLEEITKNVYNIATITSRKYSWLRRAMTASAFMFYFAGIATLVWQTGGFIASFIIPTIFLGFVTYIVLNEDPEAILSLLGV